ncbi:hypothetical protein H6P81_014764 [Aristolochia fimbriata]|uniref:Pentatricopeptide repeat-containing protein n=1 Tax=Aristolochia fimbriata TaxID=158543 RepID=A0AAV7E5E2_ARIFI|nr:hypothetical protein H6P81_014764 [Aristolochia fimbriata]
MAFLTRTRLINPPLFPLCIEAWRKRFVDTRRFSQNRFACPAGIGFLQHPVGEGSENDWPYSKQDEGGSKKIASFSETASETVVRVCDSISRCYEGGDRRLLSLQIDADLNHEQAVTVSALLVESAGPVVALGFLEWAIRRAEFRHFMRLYITTASSLIDSGVWEKAHDVMRLMLMSFLEIGKLKEAIDMVIEMTTRGLPLTIHLLNFILRIAVDFRLIDLAEYAFVEMTERGVSADICSFKTLIIAYCKNGTYTAMIGGYCKENKLNRAEMLFSRMQEQELVPNANTYTTLIHGHCKVGNFTRAYELMDRMATEGLAPNIFTYNAIINGLCKRGRLQEAHELLQMGLKHGLQADQVTYTILINENCRRADLGRALLLFNDMLKIGCKPDIHTYTTLIAAYSKQRKMKEFTSVTVAYECFKKEESVIAMAVLDRLEKKAWARTANILVRKLSNDNDVDSAALLFHKLLDMEPNANRITLTGFMTACYGSNKYSVASDLSSRVEKLLNQTVEVVI